MNRTPEEERIFDALSRVDTPAYDPTPAVMRAIREPAPRRRARPLRAVVALAACLLLTATAGAVMLHLSGGWSYFLPAVEAPAGAVSPAGVSQTVEGYTLTVEDAIADPSGLLLMTSLRRTDGGVLDDTISYSSYHSNLSAEFLVDGKNSCLGGGSNITRSEDGKTAYFLYDLHSSKTPDRDSTNVLGRTFTLRAPRVSTSEHFERSIAGKTLSALYAAHPAELSGDQDMEMTEAFSRTLDEAVAAQEAALPPASLRLMPKFDGLTLRGVVYLDGVPALVYREPLAAPHDDTADADLADTFLDGLTDTRTGGLYRYTVARSSPSYDERGRERQDESNMVVFFDPVTKAFGPDSLAELRFDYSCRVEYVQTHTPFELSFTPKSDNLVTRALDFETALDGQTLTVSECELSARCIRLSTQWSKDYEQAHNMLPAITAVLRDGTSVRCKWSMGSGGDGTMWIQYQPVDANDNRVFLDASQVTALEIAGQTAPLPEK